MIVERIDVKRIALGVALLLALSLLAQRSCVAQIVLSGTDSSAPTTTSDGDVNLPSVPPHRRTEEPPEIRRLRSKAQELADGMKRFVATQTLFQGGGGTPELSSQWEISVIRGQEHFRRLPDGTKELSRLPLPPSGGLVIADEWADLPNMIGTRIKLKVWQEQDKVDISRRLKVFSYRADIEDNVCFFLSYMDYGLFHRTWRGPVACEGEVWTDESSNILRITQDLILPPSKTKWRKTHIVVTYDWVEQSGEEPTLVPASEAFQGEFDQVLYWCTATFTDYREFSVKARIDK